MIGLIGLFYVFFFGAFALTAPRKANDPPPEFLLGVVIAVFIILFVMTLLFAIPKIVAGYGLRKGKSWAFIWAIIACCMAVMSGPLGIAVGVYGLVFIFGENGKAYFEELRYGRLSASTVTAPPPNSWQ
jgi:hypothetical protein